MTGNALPVLKPFVVAARTADGFLKCGITARSACLITKGEASELAEALCRHSGGKTARETQEKLRKLDGRQMRLLKQIGQELVERGLAEYRTSVSQRRDAGRYLSQLNFFSVFDGPASNRHHFQRRLSMAKVLILGVGGIGSHVAGALAAAGIGRLRIIDFDTVHLSNLNRQILYRESDVNRLKVDAAADALKRLNSKLRIERVCKKITRAQDLVSCLRSVDFVVCAADFPFHYIYRWVNEVCVRRGIPWIQANSAEASGFVGPLVIPRKTACFGCIEERMRRKNPDYLAEVDAILRQGEEVYHNKSCTLGPVIGMIGNFVALEIIKFITGFAKPSTLNCQLSLDFGSLDFCKDRFRQLKSCPVCGGGRVDR